MRIANKTAKMLVECDDTKSSDCDEREAHVFDRLRGIHKRLESTRDILEKTLATILGEDAADENKPPHDNTLNGLLQASEDAARHVVSLSTHLGDLIGE